MNVYISLWTTSEASPGSPREEAGVLEAGRLDAPLAVTRGLARPSCRTTCHQRLVARQNVVRPARGLEALRHQGAARSSPRNGFVLELPAERGRLAVARIDDARRGRSGRAAA